MALDRNIGSAGTGTSRGTLASTATVETISDLKSFTGAEDSCVVQGYYSPGDQGGGNFYWDSASTETANDGTIVQATGVSTGRWKRIYSGAINVKWFGAKGDGVTDDTTPLKAARDTGETIYFTGVDVSGGEYYRVTDSLNQLQGQAFIGDGFNSKIKLTESGTSLDGQLIGQNGTSSVDLIEDCLIDGLHLDTSGITNENGVGVTKAKGCVTKNCWFTNIGRKAWTAQNDVFNNKFINCHIISASQELGSTRPSISIEGQTASNDSYGNIVDGITIHDAGSHAIGLTDTNNNIISNISIKDTVDSRVIYLIGTASGDCTGNIISDITCDATNDISAELYNADENILSGINIANGTTRGVYLNLTCRDNKFINCVVGNDAVGGNGIETQSTASTGNEFYSCNVSAVQDGYKLISQNNLVIGGKITADRGINITANNNTIKTVEFDVTSSGINLNGAISGSVLEGNLFGTTGTSILMFSTAADNVVKNNISTSVTPISGNTSVQRDISGNSWQTRKAYSSSVPVSGSYTAGDFVENTASSSYTADGNNMVLFGWKRITTGSGHVLGTDWLAIYLSTVSPAT